MPAFVIPTIYTAVDRISNVNRTISSSMSSLTAQAGRMQRAFTALAPSVDRGVQNRLEYFRSLAESLALIGGVAFSGKSIMDYETAVASFRTIVSDLNDTDFSKFKKEISTVAFDTKKSTVDVAQAFEKIAGLNAKFAETAEGLGLVSTASITLAKASRMELGPAAESMVGIMNQFSFGVEQADRTINALAAGQAVGAASIQQTADALTNFGAAAAGANVTIEQSIGLIQTMAKYGQLGADAGHRLRSALIKIQEAGVGYSSGKFKIDDALQQLHAQFEALKSPMQQDAFLTKTFGLEQITAGRILLSNIATYKEFTQQVTGTNEAQKAAAINSNTLSNRLEELKNKWVNILTSSSGAGMGLAIATGAIVFLTDNMEGLLTVAVPILTFFAAWKAYIWATQVAVKALTIAQIANNFVMGMATVFNKRYAVSAFATTAGMNGMVVASYLLETSLLSLTAAALPLIGIIAIIGFGMTKGYDATVNYTDAIKKNAQGFDVLVKKMSVAEVGQQKYNEAMKEYNELQNFKAQQEYYRKRGGIAAELNTAYNEIRHPFLYDQAKQDYNGALAPKIEDYMSSSDSTTAANIYQNQQRQDTTQTIHHTVDIQSGGKTIATFDTTGAQPRTSSTAY